MRRSMRKATTASTSRRSREIRRRKRAGNRLTGIVGRMRTGSELLRSAARWMPSGVLRPFGRPVVLIFHGVTNAIEDPRIEGNHFRVEDFAKIAATLKRKFDVLPLGALDEVLARPARHPRALFLTADDGYENLLSNAAGILEDAKLPWTVFVSTHHIETGEPNPLFLARLFLWYGPAGRHNIPHLHDPVDLHAERERVVEHTITALKRLDWERAGEAIAAMVRVFPQRELATLRARFPSERYLSWDEVRTLARRGVEVGAHAHHHWPMNAHQPKEFLCAEAQGARRAVERHVGPCRFFAYPFGNVNDISREAWAAVRAAGYTHAFTTLSATLSGNGNPWLLPRYALRPREDALASVVPLLRMGNARHRHWQNQLASPQPERAAG